MRFLSIILLLIISVAAEAQQLLVVKLDDKRHVAYEVDDAKNYKFLGIYTSVRGIGEIPDPPTPPSPNSWTVTGGLHVMIVDDENLRGKLPQSQINIFTSSTLRQWLDSNAAKAKDGRPAYRLSSNDSLVEGGEARKQELPVYVQGWDLLMKSGKPLPAWIVSSGNKTIIEELPKTVDAAIARLEALK